MLAERDVDTTETITKFETKKNEVTVYQDPLHFGFWRLSLKRGALPAAFRGQYTKRIFAEAAAQEYVKSLPKD